MHRHLYRPQTPTIFCLPTKGRAAIIFTSHQIHAYFRKQIPNIARIRAILFFLLILAFYFPFFLCFGELRRRRKPIFLFVYGFNCTLLRTFFRNVYAGNAEMELNSADFNRKSAGDIVICSAGIVKRTYIHGSNGDQHQNINQELLCFILFLIGDYIDYILKKVFELMYHVGFKLKGRNSEVNILIWRERRHTMSPLRLS